jgi:hypothetical protein
MINFGAVKKFGAAAMAWVAMSAFSSVTQAAGDAVQSPEPASVSITDLAILKLEKESFALGLAYAQVTYKTTHANATSVAQITDNGAPSPIIELTTSEKILKSWPLRTGSAIIGWDINASVSYFDTHDQLVNSAFRGQDIGTKVSGGYIGVAPTLFLKMGPLYPGRDIYWKIGYGIGPGLFQGSGTAKFNTPQGLVINKVGSSSAVFALYNAASWQLQVDHWYFDIMGKWLLPQGGDRTSLESYGLGLAYRFEW